MAAHFPKFGPISCFVFRYQMLILRRFQLLFSCRFQGLNSGDSWAVMAGNDGMFSEVVFGPISCFVVGYQKWFLCRFQLLFLW